MIDAFRREFFNYEMDALRIRRLMQPVPLSQRPPMQPVEPGTQAGPGLRSTTTAERAALSMARTFRQQMAAIVGLMREALQQIVQTVMIRPMPRAILSGVLGGM